MIEDQTFRCQPIDVGRFAVTRAIGTNGLAMLFVQTDPENVGQRLISHESTTAVYRAMQSTVVYTNQWV